MNKNFDKVKIDAVNHFYGGICAIIFSIAFTGFLIKMFLINSDMFSKVIMIPFILCGIAVFIKSIFTFLQGINMRKALKDFSNQDFSNIEKIEKKQKSFNKGTNFALKLYIIVFHCFWFGFLIFFDYSAIKDWNNGGSALFLFSLLFWIAGIFSLRKTLKR